MLRSNKFPFLEAGSPVLGLNLFHTHDSASLNVFPALLDQSLILGAKGFLAEWRYVRVSQQRIVVERLPGLAFVLR